MFCSDVIARGVAERGRSRTIRPERSRQFTALSPWRALGYTPAAAACPVLISQSLRSPSSALTVRRQIRIAHAELLLSRSARTVTQVAQDCGFVDVSHLIRVFRSIHATTPEVWRRVQIRTSSLLGSANGWSETVDGAEGKSQ
jgi:AraC-like DNA-binding protein